MAIWKNNVIFFNVVLHTLWKKEGILCLANTKCFTGLGSQMQGVDKLESLSFAVRILEHCSGKYALTTGPGFKTHTLLRSVTTSLRLLTDSSELFVFSIVPVWLWSYYILSWVWLLWATFKKVLSWCSQRLHNDTALESGPESRQPCFSLGRLF